MNHAETQAKTLKVFSTLAVRAPFDRGVLAGFEHQSDLSFEWSPTTIIEQKLSEGLHADVVIATDDAIAGMVRSGLVKPENCFKLATAYFGVAVPAGQTPPDIATKQGFLDALVQARSVAYSLGGASGIYLQKIMAEQGVMEQVEPKATKIAQGFTGEKLLTGEADLAVQQMSELMTVEGITIVGGFPDELQHLTPFTIAVMNDCVDWASAQSFIHYLLTEQCRSAYASNGLMCR
ncbi:substrate-binding domain-containing protein [Erwiniaceae bacterium L1_54_6]|jgi:molybdate transport system substrate-binding protein|uniref:Molybdate ABC transporter substrate-binding protein n=1 Tax=Pantoea cypripedii TaxID=55209 RepID=A0A6B9G3Y0_PANCY|nr:substrate-binding domain-containing protein [Pantoea cypripedii]MDF7660798.1 substrate-binding domain-containing protein [Erwiniaceae bacterium L1_54_6]QGY32351.1 hypothetical protein CUN67_25545 [Pantoea cypripedii]